VKRRKGPVVTVPDAPPVEPLTLTLEEARRRYDAASAELQRLCEGKRFRMSIPVQPDDSDVILGDALQALKALTEGHDLVPRDDSADLTTAYMVGFEKGKDAARDDTAELVAALEAWLAWAAKNQAHLYFGDLSESSYAQVGDLVATSRAALARMKGGER